MSWACVVFNSAKVLSTISFSSFNSLVRLATFSSSVIFSFLSDLVRHLIKVHTVKIDNSAYNKYAHHVCHQGGCIIMPIDFSLHMPYLFVAFNRNTYLPGATLK